MEPIGDLERLWRGPGCSEGILAGAIAADDSYARRGPQPRLNRRRRVIRQQIN